MSLIQTFTTIGPPDSHGSYSKQKIKCHLVNKEVILTAQQQGIVTCSEWKKCPKHRQRGIKSCPELFAEAVLRKTLIDSGKVGLKYGKR